MRKAMIKDIENLGLKVFGDYVEINNELFPLPLVQGNEKLGKKVWHSSTLPTNKAFTVNYDGKEVKENGTCPFTCSGCYGQCGNYRFNKIKFLLAMRTRLLKEYPWLYFQLVRIQLKHENIEKLRIHAVGDFIPGEALGFYNVLIDFPSVKAWTYTKVTNDKNISLLDTLDNCNIVKSIIPGFGFNFGKIAYVANLYYYLKRQNKSVYICRCGIDKEQHCSNCDGCSNHEYVLFIEHSTGYNAVTDYGYKKMVELIESQVKE